VGDFLGTRSKSIQQLPVAKGKWLLNGMGTYAYETKYTNTPISMALSCVVY